MGGEYQFQRNWQNIYFAVCMYVEKDTVLKMKKPSITHLIMAKVIPHNIIANPPKAVLLMWFILFEYACISHFQLERTKLHFRRRKDPAE